MLAAKHFDPVVGIDIHLIQPPGPVPPLPIPHPFVGFLIDPADYVPFIGSTVQINGMHRAQAGTAGKCVPPHIPIGGVFVPPPPGNECEMFMGSATVEVDGDAQSYMSLPALSCQSIGMPTIPRLNPKKKTKPKCLMLPLSLVLPIPAGPPVMIGGPPTISISGMAMKAGLAALGKLAKALKKLQKGSKRWKALSDRLRAAAQKAMNKLGIPPSIQNKVSRAICAVTGHPVDIATGKVFTDAVDISLPGFFPLRWERVWFSTSVYIGPLGRGWHHSYDLGLVEENDAVAVRMADGRAVVFPALAVGESFFERMERLTFCRDAEGYSMVDTSGLRWRFGQVTFDSDVQKLLSISDRVDHRIGFRYDKYGHLEEITDSAERKLSVDSDEQGRITEIRGPHPENTGQTIPLVNYEYDSDGRLIVIRDALAQPMTFRYDRSLLVQETDRNGLSFNFEYDSTDEHARCIHTWGDGGIYNHRLEYDLVLRQTKVTNSLGQATLHFWNDEGLVFRSIDPLGCTKETTFSEFNQPLADIDELGQATTYEYDERGNLTALSTPDGATVTYQYDGFDLPVKAVDTLGNLWQWEHNDYGQITKKIDPTTRSVRFEYSAGRLCTVIDPSGAETRIEIDPEGNVASIVSPNGGQRQWEHDRLGRSVAITDAMHNIRRREYDLLGRVIRILEPDGNTRSLGYDAYRNITRIKDRTHNIQMTYQGMGRLSSRREAGYTVEFLYNTEEDLLAIKNADGQVYRFELDERRELSREYSFGEIRRIYTRDNAGRAVRVERASGAVTFYEYDKAGRVVLSAFSDGTQQSFSYRPDGQLMQAVNPACVVRFERDPVGRIMSEWQDDYWVTSEYDQQGLRCGMHSCFGASEDIRRDSSGRVISHRRADGAAGPNATAWEARIDRDLAGHEVDRALPGGVRSRWMRDKLGRPIRHQVDSNAEQLRNVGYEWDVNVRLSRIVSAVHGTTVFDHDEIGNLVSATYGNGSTEFRMPDSVGNLFRKKDQSDRRYGRSGEIVEAQTEKGLVRYTYDADGQLTGKSTPEGTWVYEWDAVGMVRRIVRPDGEPIEFAYDALGRRISKTFRGKTTRWIWDRNKPIHEWTVTPAADTSNLSASSSPSESSSIALTLIEANPATGPPEPDVPGLPPMKQPQSLITWVFDPDSFALAAKITGSRHYSFVTDYLGTPTAAYDSDGKEVWSASVSIYGLLRDVHGDAEFCPFRFAGQYEDAESGLCYNRHRYYDPDCGSYLCPDPIRLLGGLRLYGYVFDPLIETDPFGLGDSGILDSNLGGVVGDQHQAHHLIPCQVWEDNQAMLDSLGMERNAASNGLLMPSSEAVRGTNIAHVGSHPQYSDMVGTAVGDINTNLGAGTITPAQATQQLQDLQTDMRKKILANDPSIPTGTSPTSGCKLK